MLLPFFVENISLTHTVFSLFYILSLIELGV